MQVQIVKADNKQRQNLLIGLVAVACVAALLISLGIIYLIRRNGIMRKKLYGMGGDVESSKEYEVKVIPVDVNVYGPPLGDYKFMPVQLHDSK